jgi:hypothetical protein
MSVQKTLSKATAVRELQNCSSKIIEDILGKQEWAGMAYLMGKKG